MRTPVIRRFSALTVAALLIVPLVPAAAQEAATAPVGFNLDLGAALEAQGSTFGLSVEPESSTVSAEAVAPEVSLSEMRAEAWALQEGDDDPAAAMKSDKKGWRSWLKKRWYVPVLAAAVLAVALDDDDNDAAGEED